MDYSLFKLLVSIFGLIFTFVIITYYNMELYRIRFKFVGVIRQFFSNLFVITFFLSWLMYGFYIIVILENSFGLAVWNKYFEFWFVPLTVIFVVAAMVFGLRLIDETEVIARDYAFPVNYTENEYRSEQ